MGVGTPIDLDNDADDPELVVVERMSPIAHATPSVVPRAVPLYKTRSWAARRGAAAHSHTSPSSTSATANPAAPPSCLLPLLAVLSLVMSFLALGVASMMQLRVAGISAEGDAALRADATLYRSQQARGMVRLATLVLPPGGAADEVLAVSWSPSGSWLATVSDQQLFTLYGSGQASPGEWAPTPRRAFRGHTNEVNAVEWQPGGLRAASVSADASVVIWGAGSDPSLWPATPSATFIGTDDTPLLDVDWSPEGDWLVVGSEGGSLMLYGGGSGGSSGGGNNNDPSRWRSGSVAGWPAHVGGVTSVEFAPAGHTGCIVSGGKDGIVRIWGNGSATWLADLAAGGATPPPSTQFSGGGLTPSPVTVVAFAPDASFIASASEDGIINIWGPADGGGGGGVVIHPSRWPSTPIARLRGHVGAVTALSLAHTGLWMASGGADTTIRLWRVPPPGGSVWLTAPSLTLNGAHTDVITGVGWSPAGAWLVASSDDGTVSLWHARMPCGGWGRSLLGLRVSPAV